MDVISQTDGAQQVQSARGFPIRGPGSIEEALSADRFGRYLAWAGGDPERALDLYQLNTRLSEALYPPLQTLEIVLRNRIHGILSVTRKPDWFAEDGLLLVPHQSDQILNARAELVRENKELTPSGVVSSLTFSFWTTLLGPAYETLWQTDLHRIGRREDGKGLRRKDLSGPLTRIRLLRNRIAHHEPILTWNLPAHHAAMVRITFWLSPIATCCCGDIDRFTSIYPADRLWLPRSA
jgi:hypothetical protein